MKAKPLQIVSPGGKDFEGMITGGRARWLRSVRYDAAAHKLIFELISDPEADQKAVRILEFDAAAAYENDWFDRDDDSLEGLLGAHEEIGSTPLRYLLVTDQREIVIQTEQQPRIYEV